MKRRYPSSLPPRHRRPSRRLCITERRQLCDEERETLEDLQAATGHIFGRDPRLSFKQEFSRWMDQHPNDFIPYLKRHHARICSRARKQGIENPDDLPEQEREVVHQAALTLAGDLFQSITKRLDESLYRKKVPETLAIMEQAVIDAEQVVEYLLDVREPERSQWLALVEPLRADCHRAAGSLRRKTR